MKKSGLLFVLLALASPLFQFLRAQPVPAQGMSSADILLGIQKAQVMGTVLYVAAHPDDENTAMLSWLAKGRKVRTAYLALTRGDGGQNLIGTEQGPLMGLIRTQELLAARRIDGAEQYFTRAIDYGFSKTPEEAFRIWNRDSILRDVVWVIRSLQPDAIITRFPVTGEGGHGHHTASAILAEEAFAAAADPKRFPEQLRYVTTWQAKRIFWNSFQGFRGETLAQLPQGMLGVDLGQYNPLLGESYTEVAGRSRSQHSSQGFGAARRRGARMDYLQHRGGEPARTDLLEGVDLSWNRLNLPAVGEALAQAEKAFDPLAPEKSLPHLLEALRLLNNVGDNIEAEPLLVTKRREITQLAFACAGIYLEATAPAFTVQPGTDPVATLAIVRRRPTQVPVRVLDYTKGRADEFVLLPDNQLVSVPGRVIERYPLAWTSTLYWLSQPANGFRFQHPHQQLVGQPEYEPFQVVAEVAFGEKAEQILSLRVPVRYKWVDPTFGERLRPIEVAPPVLVSLPSQALVFANGAQEVKVRVTSTAGAQKGEARLKAPNGWQVSPTSLPFDLADTDAEQVLAFTVTPPKGPADAMLQAEVQVGANTWNRSRTRIEYPHIPIQTLYPLAQSRLTKVELASVAKRVGYIMGAGDEVPEALKQVGLQVDMLSDETLLAGDLSVYDAIVIGVRAFNTERRLRAWMPRLIAYAEAGGTVVEQYNTSQGLVTDKLGPFALTLGRGRVTEEDAALNAIDARHPALNFPNRLVAADYQGWVQERGLYFAETWAPEWKPIFRTQDVLDGDPTDLQGALLVARCGKGHFVYTGLAFFRQLPAGVPGAYRLFVNLLNLGKANGSN